MCEFFHVAILYDLALPGQSYATTARHIYIERESEVGTNKFFYRLAGSIKNYEAPAYAFQASLAALRSGQYFIGDGGNQSLISNLASHSS